MGIRAVMLVLGAGLAASVGATQENVSAKASKYPLRLHVLAIDDSHKTVRMQPNWSSGSVPEGDEAPSSAGPGGSASLGGGDDDFSGAGRADLVTPPNGTTVGMNFSYEGCSRVRVAPGFSGLAARWTKPGTKLEVMVPTDAVTDGPVKMQRCSLKVVPQEFVYLRLKSGAIAKVTQEAYAKKPSLRKFLSGGAESLKRR